MSFTSYPAFAAFLSSRDELSAVDIHVTPEEQGSDYEAGLAHIGPERWRLRTARVTPVKPGGFVAVWRRGERGDTEPFPSAEPVAGLLVFLAEGDRRGRFRFTAEHLARLGVSSAPGRPGKRGFRVYPAWCVGLNQTARKALLAQAEAWQEF
ncbi:MepB family protein [Leucobacter sp. HY1910]